MSSSASTLTKQSVYAVAAESLDYSPVRILEMEIGQQIHDVPAVDEKTGRCYQRAKCLVRLHTYPLGVVEFSLGENGINAEDCATLIWQNLEEQINVHLRQDGLPSVTELHVEGLPCLDTPQCIEERERYLADSPFVSVIIPTHNRLDSLPKCLDSLLSLHYPHYEIIVVDNAPSSNATADFIHQHYGDMAQVRYVREDRPGPSFARNRGIMVAKGKILAFADDDVEVDRYWLAALIRPFSLSEDVVCVTGLVLPLELETPSQFWFEEYGGFTRGYNRRIFDMKEHHPRTPLYPYAPGSFGTGASMAFTAAFLQKIGGFDPAFGGNSVVKCGQDILAFFQVITKGYKLVYEPAALLYHQHRREYSALCKQMYNYGIGWTALVTKGILENPVHLFKFMAQVPYSLFFLLGSRSPRNQKKTMHYPKELTKLERRGMLYGPLAYMQSQWIMRKARKFSEK